MIDRIFALLLLVLTAPLVAMGGNASDRASGENEPLVTMIGIWDRAKPMVERASRTVDVPVRIESAEKAIEIKAFPQADVVYILNFSSKEAAELKNILQRETRTGLKVIPLDKRGVHSTLDKAALLHHDPKVPEYWRANGAENIRRLLNYTADKYLGMDRPIKPPIAIPSAGFYHPDLARVVKDFSSYKSKLPRWKKGAPVAAYLIHQSFWVTEDTAVINALIAELEETGFNVATFFSMSESGMRKRLKAVEPDVIIEQRHGGRWEGGGEQSLLEKINAPYLNPISMLQYTIPQWRKDPAGMHPADRSLFLTLQETDGEIEPLIIGGLKKGVHGFKLHKPIPERVKRFAQRTRAWINLRRKQNAKKKIAIVYYNKYMGKANLMRGSPTGAFLDAPASMMNFLPKLKEKGYHITSIPGNEKELIRRVKQHGRNYGPWARDELEKMVRRSHEETLIPASEYKQWFRNELSKENRQAVREHFGAPPGRLMVVQRHDQKFIVIPTVRMGNVLLAPQPVRGGRQDKNLVHNQDVPPPHNYLAFYWWLQKEFKADAMIHWGTHGTLELLPGKEAGLSRPDWSDICAGTIPVINPWIMDNIGEATLSRRRSYALLVDHLNPPSVTAELSPPLKNLQSTIDKWKRLEKGVLRKKFRSKITNAAEKQNLLKETNINRESDAPLRKKQIEELHNHLHEQYNASTPMTLHVLGEPPADKWLPSYLVRILGKDLREALKQTHDIPSHPEGKQHEEKWLQKQGRRFIRRTVLEDKEPPDTLKSQHSEATRILSKLKQADHEISNLLRALNGEYIRSGPGPGAVRNRASIPSGRNLYALNPKEIPTHSAWEVGKELVKDLLEQKKPTKVGFDLNGMNTMRDYGVNEAQILYLLGVRPIWDERNRVIDVELIPKEKLGRRRIDVFIGMGGQYKENFPSRVELLDKAVRLASRQKEPGNLVRKGTKRMETELLKKGFAEDKAEKLAKARIFGTKPGNMSGTKILYLVPRSGAWDKRREITDVYIDNMNFVYTRDIWGKRVEGLYESAIQGTDTLIRAWASNMTSQLSNHHAYEYLGGMSMAVKQLTGKEADAFIADVRDPAGGDMKKFKDVLQTNLRSELLNKKWIKGMKQKDCAGAGQIAELVKNTFGWETTRSSSVNNSDWSQIYRTYIEDRYNLSLKEWFNRVNPHALQEIAATMLEAARREYWHADAEQISKLSWRYAKSVVKHGSSDGLMSGGNEKLESYVKDQLQAPGDQKLAKKYAETRKQTRAEAQATEKQVTGKKLTQKQETKSESKSKKQKPAVQRGGRRTLLWWAVGGVLLLCIGVGIWRRSGSV